MNILVLNSGSSTLKFELVRIEAGEGGTSERLAAGLVERIGDQPRFVAESPRRSPAPQPVAAPDHRGAVTAVFDSLRSVDPKLSIDAVGHRVVHGGERFVCPVLIDEAVLQALEPLSELAPLHNPGALQGIRAARETLGPDLPMVAVFDTAFHASLPEAAASYALPASLTRPHAIRRYGFHGLAHESMLLQYAQFTGVPPDRCRLVTLQLGNGCSAAAISGGHSVDTSMGFTPLEGLVMGTRGGDLDPGVLLYLERKTGMTMDELERCLNHEAGLLGLSGLSSDMRDLLAAAEGDPRAALAAEVFCYRARKYVGAYLAALGGADAVVFGGGIGEHSPEIRRRICAGMEWCGLTLDPARNTAITGSPGRITTDDSRTHAFVFPVDEAALIARRTAEAILTTAGPGPTV